MSTSLADITKREDGKTGDHGWACGASSGQVAIHREKPDEVYLIGHDLHSATDKVNNLYKGTKHYVAPENGPTPAVNWINQWYTLAGPLSALGFTLIKFVFGNSFIKLHHCCSQLTPGVGAFSGAT